VAAPGAGFCDACLTGEYPVAITASAAKGVLDGEVRNVAERAAETTISLLEGIDGNNGSAMLPADHAAQLRAVAGAGAGAVPTVDSSRSPEGSRGNGEDLRRG